MSSKKRSNPAGSGIVEVLPAISSIDDLIELCHSWTPPKRRRGNTQFYYRLRRLIDPLEKLQRMVGLHDIKHTILSQLLYFLQGLNDDKLDMLHTVIQGPPGVGKTKLARILGEIYLSIGVLKSSAFVIARRSDLVGKYLGHTADKTQSVIDSCRGGVLLIDEAYSLGHAGDNKDSFSKECIDTLNQNLTENCNNFMCIIAGYENALNECFFSSNEGLARRFTFRYTLEPYKPDELYEIFLQMVRGDGWKIEIDPCKKGLTQSFFKDHEKLFPNSAGDLETLYLHVKLGHARRLIVSEEKRPRFLNIDDVLEGLKGFQSSRQSKLLPEGPPPFMYL